MNWALKYEHFRLKLFELESLQQNFCGLERPRMKLALVFPPLADATQPYASLPALAAFLRERGNHVVTVHDMNLGFTLALWTPERLKAAESRILDRLREIESETRPSTPVVEEYAALMTACLKAPLVAEADRGSGCRLEAAGDPRGIRTDEDTLSLLGRRN
jgi:hypothetical protein